MDENQQDTITRLKFLGKVNKGEKINVKELTLQSEGYVTALSRSVWCVDNRNNTISFIQNTIQAAFNLIQLLSKNNGVSDQELAKKMRYFTLGVLITVIAVGRSAESRREVRSCLFYFTFVDKYINVFVTDSDESGHGGSYGISDRK